MKEEYIVKMDQDEVDAISLICTIISGNHHSSSRDVFSPPDQDDNIFMNNSTHKQYFHMYGYRELRKYRHGIISFHKKV
jgi:hypothetical protein